MHVKNATIYSYRDISAVGGRGGRGGGEWAEANGVSEREREIRRERENEIRICEISRLSLATSLSLSHKHRLICVFTLSRKSVLYFFNLLVWFETVSWAHAGIIAAVCGHHCNVFRIIFETEKTLFLPFLGSKIVLWFLWQLITDPVIIDHRPHPGTTMSFLNWVSQMTFWNKK